MNCFFCGGLGIGVSFLYKVVDGKFFIDFVNFWVIIICGIYSYDFIVLKFLFDLLFCFFLRDLNGNYIMELNIF